MTRRIVLSVVLTFIAVFAVAQPTPQEYLGYPLGERFTSYDRILEYFNELAKQSSLVTIEQIGETYEHRPLVLATITSAKNRAALDEIRRNVTMLANGEGDAAQIAKNTPAIVWLAFGVHGKIGRAH